MTCIPSIDPASIFYEGPFGQGTNQLLTHFGMKNTGTNDCLFFAKFVKYPGQPNEEPLGDTWQRVVLSGTTKFIDFYWEVPDYVTTCWPLGVKLWWQDDPEGEPDWGTPNTHQWCVEIRPNLKMTNMTEDPNQEQGGPCWPCENYKPPVYTYEQGTPAYNYCEIYGAISQGDWIQWELYDADTGAKVSQAEWEIDCDPSERDFICAWTSFMPQLGTYYVKIFYDTGTEWWELGQSQNFTVTSPKIILRPDADIDINLESINCSPPNQHQCVNPGVPPDNENQCVMNQSYNPSEWLADTYGLPNHGNATGAIDKLIVFWRIKENNIEGYHSQGKFILIDTVNANNNETTMSFTPNWATSSTEYTINPATGEAWTWEGVDGLRIKIDLKSNAEPLPIKAIPLCNQVYVLIYYVPLTQPEICDWIDSKGGPTALTIDDVFVIIDSYLYNTPPEGYNFIPMLQNVFGVIDYFLGFDGDPLTGCDYYP